jgi:Uncharacterised protein family (UPF0158)
MLKPTEIQIKEAAGEMECGLICYWNTEKGSFLSIPDMNDPCVEPEMFEEDLAELENNAEHYIKIEPMESYESFQIMEDFAEQLQDTKFQNKLQNILTRKKPFREFKSAIDNSDYREDWFAFRSTAYKVWVVNALEREMD